MGMPREGSRTTVLVGAAKGDAGDGAGAGEQVEAEPRAQANSWSLGLHPCPWMF